MINVAICSILIKTLSFLLKKGVEFRGATWECVAPGIGIRGDYGNGSISIRGNEIELLSPLYSDNLHDELLDCIKGIIPLKAYHNADVTV